MSAVRSTGDAVIATLRGGGLLVGDADAPSGAGWQGEPGHSAFVPYVIVYPTGGGGVDGPIGAIRADETYVYQCTCVGQSRQQTDWLRDRVRDVLFNAEISIEARRVMTLRLDMPIATTRDDDTSPPVFYSADRFRILTTPKKVWT